MILGLLEPFIGDVDFPENGVKLLQIPEGKRKEIEKLILNLKGGKLCWAADHTPS